MKSLVSLMLVACLLLSTPTLTAQERLESPGPIREAIAPEAALMAVEQKPAADPEWRRVTAIAPGTQLLVAGRDARVRAGRFATADDASLTIVHLNGAPIPAAVKRQLEDDLAAHPDYFLGARRGQFLLGQNVRMTPDGVFVADQKAIGLDQLVETIARADVQQITTAGKTGGSASWAAAGAAAGAALGMMSAVHFAFSPCGGSCADEKMFIGLSLVGLPVLGGVWGYKAGGHDVARIFYRAP